MKILNRGRSVALGLALVVAGMAAPHLGGEPASAAQPDPSVVDQMRSTATGKVAVRANPATGRVGFVRAAGAGADLLPSVDAEDRGDAAAKADAYLDRYAGAFGARSNQLDRTAEVTSDRSGWTFTYAQSYQGIPVFGGELKAHVAKDGALTSVNGFTAPSLSLSTTPRVSEQTAVDRALAMVRERPAGYEDAMPELTKGITARSSTLEIYRMGSTRGIAGDSRLAWVVEVWNKSSIRETVVIDAQTGKWLNRWSMMAEDLDRTLVEADGSDDPATFTEVWHEGDPFPDGLNEDQQNEVLGTAEAYWLFKNTFGRDSYDGEGSPMITVNNDGRIDCPNANWNGVTTNYCDGVTGDDTVAHEWGHAYTEYTSGLIYQWQAGAMNEAYSDIWGETVDMLNARMNEKGEDPADPILREPGKCSIYQPASYDIAVSITAPAEIAGPCTAAPAAFGPELTGTQDITVVVGLDEDTDGDANDPIANDTVTNGCSAPYTNAADVTGKWVFVDRGFCTFQAKVDNAEAAGAIGIVIGDNRPEVPFGPSGVSDIPGFMVTQDDGDRVKSVTGPVTMSVERLSDPRATDDTYRWLSGENDPAFGGAIRDMWNPTCFGDPGKVSDEEYVCDTGDSGGVHTNSGVVNRTYAILVDGLPGVVDGIGLDKAANLFWHAQSNYLTPTSYFPDLADALEASCADLTGVPINKATLGNPTEADGSDGAATPEVIAGGLTAADCTSVRNAIAETELRLDPTEQCNWQRLLEQGTLSCGKGFVTSTTWSEDFEDGLDGWTQDEELTFPEGHGYAWEASTDAPDGHEGGVAFAPDPANEGSCGGDADDVSSRNGLISPEITVPAGHGARLSFDHWVATESGWDGGNVKVSVDGGDFELVPATAYLFNGPRTTLQSEGAGNTNPMAGEPAWTGTDGGQLGGSWGQTVISLGRLGATPGDTVQFRFDMGRDGCNGVEGWYVDNVAVAVCKAVAGDTTTEVLSVTPDPVKEGKPFTVKVHVTSPDGIPTGIVKIKEGTTKLGVGALNANGVAWVKVTRTLAAGKHDLTAKYTGDGDFKPSQDDFRVKVVS